VLAVRTWIADFRRVRSLREYSVQAGDRVVAEASTDWVFVDRTTNRPRRIPDEWQATFMLGAVDVLERTPFPAEEPPANASSGLRRIELHDLDALRHVNNSNYVSYIEQAVHDTLDAAGWNLDTQLAAGGRLRALRHDLEYLDAALLGERVRVTAWPTSVTTHQIEYHVHLHRTDAPRTLLQARSRYAWTTPDGETAVPAGLRSALGTP
jgi:YbgC/YbaW family acyl-CoA thioester hydrolase